MTEGEISIFPEDSVPYDVTYGQWTVKWWHWALSTPKSISPIVDQSGEYASVNQPTEDVWFLAGKFGNEDRNLPNRFCRIPAERSILFPVIIGVLIWGGLYLRDERLRTLLPLRS